MRRNVREESEILALKLAGGVIRAERAHQPSTRVFTVATRSTSPAAASLVKLRQMELESLVGGLAERSVSPLQPSPSPPRDSLSARRYRVTALPMC